MFHIFSMEQEEISFSFPTIDSVILTTVGNLNTALLSSSIDSRQNTQLSFELIVF